MRLRCPTCSSHYDLADDLIGEGRMVRCAHCRMNWHATPFATAPAEAGPVAKPAAEAAPMRDAEPAAQDAAPQVAAVAAGHDIVAEARSERFPPRQRPTPTRRKPPAPRIEGRLGRAAASALILALPCAGMAAIAQKELVVRAIPASSALFEAIGLPVNLRGLALGDFHGTIEPLGSGPVLTLQGRISNLRDRSTAVPTIRIAVRDKDRRELYSWTAHAPKAKLDAGESLTIRSRLAAPPEGAQDLIVSFADAAPEVAETAKVAERTAPADAIAALAFRTGTQTP